MVEPDTYNTALTDGQKPEPIASPAKLLVGGFMLALAVGVTYAGLWAALIAGPCLWLLVLVLPAGFTYFLISRIGPEVTSDREQGWMVVLAPVAYLLCCFLATLLVFPFYDPGFSRRPSLTEAFVVVIVFNIVWGALTCSAWPIKSERTRLYLVISGYIMSTAILTDFILAVCLDGAFS